VDRVITIVVRLTGFLRLGLGCWRLFHANPKHVNTLVEADQVVTVDLERGIARGWLENTEEQVQSNHVTLEGRCPIMLRMIQSHIGLSFTSTRSHYVSRLR